VAIALLSRLTYWYPNRRDPALRDIDLSIDDGLTVVVGPSGGGKSTLLRVFNGLVPHFYGGRIAGAAEVAGMNVFDTPTRRLARTVGFVFQDPELQTVYDVVDREVAFGLENVAMPAREIPARVEEALDAAGIGHLAGRRVQTLSGGERQRVALAAALAMKPRIVVLDEPSSQLDPDGAAMVLSSAAGIARDGRAVVISEHRLERLAQAARAMILVDGGTASRVEPASWSAPVAAPSPQRTSAPGPEAWSLRGVAAGFGDRMVLDGVDLTGRSGEVVALSGPNGGGKTTLLRIIAGGLAPLSGRVERRPGRIAYLPQNPTALLHLPTVRAEVSFTLQRSGALERPEVVLRALGLLQVADRYPRDLACGERQRAALAAVIPGRPGLVLLDEPTRGMDAPARDALVRVVAALRDAGTAVVLATHDTALRAAVADRVVDVSAGKVSEMASQAAIA
jgi:energy-coupling factor transporter ATP-binding protein EcfA2